MKSSDEIRPHFEETKKTSSMSILMATQSVIQWKKWTDMMTDCFNQHPF